MKQNLMKQFLVDMNMENDVKGHVFRTGIPNHAMRYWARSNATMFVANGRLFCRTDNENLTRELTDRYHQCNAQWFGEVENLKELEMTLNKYGYTIVNYAPFYIPDFVVEAVDETLTYFYGDDIKQFKGIPQFQECYGFDDENPDLVGVALKQNGEIIAMAGLNQTGQFTNEIGIAVLPEFRQQGLGARLVRAIASRSMQLFPDRVVTYGTQFTHTQSINTAVRAGFVHAWTELMISKKK